MHENRLTKTLPQMLSKYVEVLSTNATGKKRVKSHIQHEVKKKKFLARMFYLANNPSDMREK